MGSGRYINAVRLDMVKSSPHRSPEVWAVEIVLKFMGSQQNALRIFQGKGMGLYAAFGSDFVADITGKDYVVCTIEPFKPCTRFNSFW